MLKLAQPYFLYLLLVIPILIVLFWYVKLRRQKLLKQFGDSHLISRLIPRYSGFRTNIKFIFLLISLSLIILALARPQTGSKLEKVKRSGIDMVIALDVSRSMEAQDVAPNRLENAKQTVLRLLNTLENDRIALVVFAGKSYVQMPLTNDLSATRLFLSEVNTGMVPTQGTAIGAAIKSSMQCFTNNSHSKAIVIITDGENHEDDAVNVAKEASLKGIKVFPVAVGSAQGAPIPIYSGNNMIGYKKDSQGSTIISRVDEQTLKEIASVGNGVFIRSGSAHATAKMIGDQLDKMNKNEYSTVLYSDFDEVFQFPLIIGILFLIFNILIGEQKSKYADKLNPFKNKN